MFFLYLLFIILYANVLFKLIGEMNALLKINDFHYNSKLNMLNYKFGEHDL